MTKKTQTEGRIKKNAFVHKLYSMLNDPKLDHLIWWTTNNTLPEGNTFALYPGKEFADCLTRYFKHGNVASFVRQLHMYGFHKVSDGNSNSNTQDKDVPPIWEFKHSSGKFKRGDESSLIYIKRRSSSNSARNNHHSQSNNHHMFAEGQYHPHYQPHPQHIEYAIPYEQYYQPHPGQPYVYMQQQQQHIQHMQGQPFPYPQQKQPLPQPQVEYIQVMPIPTPSPIPVAMSQREIYLVKHESQIESPVSSYTPNLQFRKIWDENTNTNTRPRNASYFDPLASPGAGGVGTGSVSGTNNSFNIPRNSSVNSTYSTDSKQSYLPPPPLSTGATRSTSMISPSTPDPSQALPMAVAATAPPPTVPPPQAILQQQQQLAVSATPVPRSIPNEYLPNKKPSFYSQTRPNQLPSLGSITSITSNNSSIFSNKSSISSITSLPPAPVPAPTPASALVAPPPSTTTQINSSLNKILTPTPTSRPPSTPLPQEVYSPSTTNPVYPRVRSLSPQSMLNKHNLSPKLPQPGIPLQPHRALTSSPLSKEKNSKVSVNSLLDDTKVI